MELVLFVSGGLALLWLLVIAIISERPPARLARGALASAAVVAGGWASTASAGISEVGDVSVVVALLRSLA